jgi:hypothetical protein
MDLSFLIYLFLAITSISGGTYYFFMRDNQIAGGIYGLGSLIVSVFFGMRWFLPSGVGTTTPGTWPPVINVCPDFMSLVTLTPAASSQYGVTATPQSVCVDTIGIYKDGIKRWQTGDVAEDKLFYLFTNVSDVKARLKKLCDQCTMKKVTWEGVYTDGTCGSVTPPLPK